MLHALESLELRRLLSNTGIISGSVYKDLNFNARHEAGEGGMKSVRVYLDANNNGKFDKRETSVLTDKRGQFRFETLAAGTYRLREVTPDNHIPTGPRSTWFRITLADGQHVARRQFANAPVQTSTDGGTIGGETDFNGVVNFDDYARVPSDGSSTGWFEGDFDYNSSVSFSDYALIDLAFNTQTGTLIRAIDFLEGTDRSSDGMSTPALQKVQENFQQFGTEYASNFLEAAQPTPTEQPSIKSIAKADFKRTHADHSLLSAKAYLLGNKDVIRSEGLYTVIEHWHQYGIEYKREFLRLARDY